MNMPSNSTSAHGGATAILDSIDKRDGIQAQAIKVKNLSRILMSDLENSFRSDRARKIESDSLTFIFRRESLDTTLWLMAELWGAAHDIAEQIDALSDALNDSAEGK